MSVNSLADGYMHIIIQSNSKTCGVTELGVEWHNRRNNYKYTVCKYKKTENTHRYLARTN